MDHLSGRLNGLEIKGQQFLQQIVPGRLLGFYKHLVFKAGPLAQLAEQRTLNP